MTSTLLNDFYSVLSFEMSSDKLESDIEINATHKIFAGHFPGQPVVPGVCMMQIIKESAEHFKGYALVLEKVQDMKFLAVIDPSQNNKVKISAAFAEEGERLSVNATITHEETVHFKFRGSFLKKH